LGLGLGLGLGATAVTLRNSALETVPLLSMSHSLKRSTMRTALFMSASLIRSCTGRESLAASRTWMVNAEMGGFGSG
jgi:hypothetical protein